MKNVFEKLMKESEIADVVGLYDKETESFRNIHAVLEERTENKVVYVLNPEEYPFLKETLLEPDYLDVSDDGFRLVFSFTGDVCTVSAEVGKRIAAELNPILVFSSEAIDERVEYENVPMYVLGIIWEYYNNPENAEADDFNLRFFFRCMYNEPSDEDRARMAQNRALWDKAIDRVKAFCE